ncbi:MAG: hypothetical protein V4491_01865, partial [Pseudomonadota bacterium]
MASIFGIGLGAHEIVHQLVEVAEKAEHLENLAFSTGIPVEEFAKISGAIQLATGNADTASRVFQVMERNIRNALENPAGQQGLSFRALKIDAEELAEGLKKPADFLLVLADRAERFVANSPAPALGIAALKDVLGRDVDALAPALARGPEHFSELLKEAGELLGLTTDRIHRLALTAEEINKVTLGFTGLKAAIVDGFNEPIRDALDGMQKWISEAKNIELIKDAFKWLGDEIKADVEFLKSVFGLIEKASTAKNAILPPTEDEGVRAVLDRKAELAAGQPNIVGGSGGLATGGALGRTGKASWFGPWPGHPEWADSMNEGMPNASGAPLSTPGIALYDKSTLGKWFVVSGPDGKQFVLPQVDVGPAPWTGKGIDINAPAASQMGYSPKDFPTGGNFSWRPATVEEITTARAGEAVGGGESAERLKIKEAELALKRETKQIDDELKIAERGFERETIEAHGDQAALHDIQQRTEAKKQELLTRKQVAIAKHEEATAGLVVGGDATDIKSSLMKSQNDALKEQISYEDKLKTAAVARLETDRKIADQAMTTQLAGVEGRRQMGDITVSQAAVRELQIVEDHKRAVDRIYADELAAAGDIKTLHDKIVNDKALADAKYEEQKKRIEIKSGVEEAQREKAIDAEIARTAASGIVGTAWGTTTPGKALASSAQSLETKALEFAIEKGMKASGVGKALDQVFTTLSEKVFGKAVDTAVDSVATTAPIVGAVTATGATTAGAIVAQTAATIPLLTQIAFASAVAATPSVAGFSLAGGGVIPSAAGGMTVNDGKGGRIAIVHPNEMVLPQYLSEGVQGMVAKGGGAATGGAGAGAPSFHYAPQINAPESPDLKQLLQRHGNDMLYWLQAQ